MSEQSLDNLVEELARMAIDLGLNMNQIKDCLNKAAVEQEDYEGKEIVLDDESKGGEEEDIIRELNRRSGITNDNRIADEVTLQEDDLLGFDFNNNNNNNNNNNPPTTSGNNNQYDDDGFLSLGKTEFGKKILSKATESVRQIAKKKGIYIVGRKGKKFLGIRFTKKGNYSKNKKGRPNGKMYTLASLRKMKKKRVSFKKLPQLIDMMDTGAVLKKHKNFKFGFELKKQPRGCGGFGYSFPVGAGYGKRSALLYGKL